MKKLNFDDVTKQYVAWNIWTGQKYETWAKKNKAKAINNVWWKYVKGCDEMPYRSYEPSAFEAVEIN